MITVNAKDLSEKDRLALRYWAGEPGLAILTRIAKAKEAMAITKAVQSAMVASSGTIGAALTLEDFAAAKRYTIFLEVLQEIVSDPKPAEATAMIT